MDGAHAVETRFPKRALIGMVHVGALPGTPGSADPVERLAEMAAAEASVLVECGFDGVIVENMHDAPYLRGRVGPEIVAAMTVVTRSVRAALPGSPLGVQVLAGANHESLAIALAAGASFVRVENFVFSHVSDEGLMPEAAAGPLLRYRRSIGAERVAVFADIKKKHAAHAITADVSLAETAHAAEFSGADAVIVTGPSTGRPAEAQDVQDAGSASLPVFVGSGVTAETAGDLLEHADGVIVGSAIKHEGDWRRPIDPARARAFVRAAGR